MHLGTAFCRYADPLPLAGFYSDGIGGFSVFRKAVQPHTLIVKVGCEHNGAHAVSFLLAHQVNGGVFVGGTVVYAGKQMAMQIN